MLIASRRYATAATRLLFGFPVRADVSTRLARRTNNFSHTTRVAVRLPALDPCAR